MVLLHCSLNVLFMFYVLGFAKLRAISTFASFLMLSNMTASVSVTGRDEDKAITPRLPPTVAGVPAEAVLLHVKVVLHEHPSQGYG